MEGKRFDQLARALATRGSRRRVLGGLLAGALGGLRSRPTAADDSGTAIADASGGNHNLASAADQASSGQDHDHDHDHDGGHDKDHGDGGHGGGKPCPCIEPISGACVEFCPLDETFEDGECCCPDDTNHCSTANPDLAGKFICCPSDQFSCSVSQGALTCGD